MRVEFIYSKLQVLDLQFNEFWWQMYEHPY